MKKIIRVLSLILVGMMCISDVVVVRANEVEKIENSEQQEQGRGA